jgi:hypothetical protein
VIQSMAERSALGERAASAERFKTALGVVGFVFFALWIVIAATGKAVTGGVGAAQWAFVALVVLWPIVSFVIARRAR